VEVGDHPRQRGADDGLVEHRQHQPGHHRGQQRALPGGGEGGHTCNFLHVSYCLSSSGYAGGHVTASRDARAPRRRARHGLRADRQVRQVAQQRLARQPQPDLSRARPARGRGHGRGDRRGRARNSKTWALTDAGRKELRRWLVEVEPSRQQRSESALRTFLAPSLLEPDDARVALERDPRVRDRPARDARVHQVGDDREPAATGPSSPAVDLGLRMTPVMEGWIRRPAGRIGRRVDVPAKSKS